MAVIGAGLLYGNSGAPTRSQSKFIFAALLSAAVNAAPPVAHGKKDMPMSEMSKMMGDMSGMMKQMSERMSRGAKQSK